MLDPAALTKDNWIHVRSPPPPFTAPTAPTSPLPALPLPPLGTARITFTALTASTPYSSVEAFELVEAVGAATPRHLFLRCCLCTQLSNLGYGRHLALDSTHHCGFSCCLYRTCDSSCSGSAYHCRDTAAELQGPVILEPGVVRKSDKAPFMNRRSIHARDVLLLFHFLCGDLYNCALTRCVCSAIRDLRPLRSSNRRQHHQVPSQSDHVYHGNC